MARVLVLLCLSTCILKAGHSLQWQGELRRRFVNCSGQEVTFPWSFRLQGEDTLLGISWSHRPMEAGAFTTIGVVLSGTFTTENQRLSQVKDAGIKLSDIRSSDSGVYIVNIRLSSGLITQNTSLLVAEPPQTRTGRLEVALNSLPVSSDTTTSGSGSGNSITEQTLTVSRAGVTEDGKDRLYCGEFLHLGVPPVSVVWESPDGRILPSTSYVSGYFTLDLPEDGKGGHYHCLLNLSSTAVGCLPPDAALRDKVHVVVVVKPPPSSVVDTTSETKVSTTPSISGASISGGVIATIVIIVVILVAVIIIVFVFVFLRRRKGKSYAPKEPESPGPEEDDSRQPFKDV